MSFANMLKSLFYWQSWSLLWFSIYPKDWEPSQLFPSEAIITDTLQVQHSKSGFFTRKLREWWFHVCFWSHKRSANCRRKMTMKGNTTPESYYSKCSHSCSSRNWNCILWVFVHKFHYMSLLKFHEFPFWQWLEIRITKSLKDVWLRRDRWSYDGTAVVGFPDLRVECLQTKEPEYNGIFDGTQWNSEGLENLQSLC